MANLLSTTVNGNVLVGPSGTANAYDGAATGKLYFGNQVSDSPTHYHITTNMENFGGSYSKLDIRWYTGQRFYAHYAYGGFRFKEITTGNNLFSIGEGDVHVRVDNNLYIAGNLAIHAGNIGSQSVSYATSAGNSDTVDSLHASSFVRNDTTRQYLKPYFEYGEYLTTQSPLDLVNQMGGGGFRVDFLHPSYTANGNWGHVMTWSGYNGYTMYQMSGSSGAGADVELYVRNETNHGRGAWSSWRRLLHDNNYNSYSPTLTGTGASGTWGISITGNSATTSQRDFSGDISTSGMGRFAGWYTGNAQTGLAAEIGTSVGQVYIIAYNRQTSAYGTLNIESSGANLRVSGSTVNVTSGTLQQGGNNVIHAGNIASQSVSYATSAGSASTAGSAGSVDGLTINNSGAPINPNNVTQNQIGYNDSVALFGQSDGGLYSSAYSSSWIHQIYGDFRTGQIAIRGKNANTWGDWRIVVDDRNIASYAVPYGNMTSSTGLNDNKLYLRTNGDNNHYIWNAADDWEEIVAYSGTGLRIASSTGVTLATFTTSGLSVNGTATVTGGGSYPVMTTSLQRYMMQIRNTNNSVNASYGWWWFMDTNFNMGFHADGAADRFTLTRDGNLTVTGSFTTTNINAPNGYVSNGNPWGTANSAYFPNGITTAGSDNWIYGHTYVGNAPGNGNGHEFWADGNMKSTGHHYLDANYGQTIVGKYSSTVYQGVWAMGDSYKLPMNGSTTGSLYGLAWSHPNAGGVAANLNTHGLLVMENGTFLAAISGSIRSRDDMRAPIFYDSANTAYYGDFAGISSMYGVAIRGDLSSTDTSNQIFFWGAGNSTTSAIGFKANGGNFTNPTGAGDGYNTYFTMDSPGRGWVFREGTGGTNFAAAYTSGWILNNGVWQANASMRAPIFYDSADTAYYLDPNGNSVLTTATFNVNASSTLILTSGGTNASQIKAGAGDELYIGGNNTWQMRFNGGNVLMDNGGYLQNDQSLRAPIFYDSQDTAYYVDPNGTSNLLKLSTQTMAYNGMNPMSASSPYVDRYNGGANYRNGTMGNGTVGLDVIGSNWGSGFIDSWGSPANQPNGSTSHWVGLQSIHYNHQNGTNFYGFQMLSGAETNRFYLRAAWPTPLSWLEIITTGNIGSQSVSYASSAGNADTVDGFHASVAGTANTIPTRNASGYLIPENWIQLNGIYGLYSPTNNAHLRPNDGSYGSWLVTGSRNGWRGLEFDSGNNGNVSLMVNASSNTTGFHNNSYGWQFYWEGGTLYCSKNAYGAGTNATVLDSSNFGSWAAASSGNGGVDFGSRSLFFSQTNYDFTLAPRASISSMSIKLWDNYFNNSGLGSDYGSLLDIYGRGGHVHSQFYMDASNGIWYRSSPYAGGWNSWGQFLTSANFTTWAQEKENQRLSTTSDVTHNSTTSPLFLVNGHSDNTKGYRIHNTSGSSVSAMFTNSSNQLVIAAGAVDQINLNKKVYVNGVALGVNIAPSATAGRIDASNDIVAYSSSDERLKQNITPIANALDKVKSLTGVEFDWKPENKGAHGHEGHDTGIIAQQVLGVMPTAVRTNDTGYLAVRYEKLIGLLIEGMKEQQAQIEELKAQLNGLTK